jgi:uncharacterized membrane protein YedE/YeeE
MPGEEGETHDDGGRASARGQFSRDRIEPVLATSRRGNERSFGQKVGGAAASTAVVVIAALAVGYLVADSAWLWSLLGGVTGPAVSTGLMLVRVAVLLRLLAGGRRLPATSATWRES